MTERLEFLLDDFTRTQWAAEAREVWEPRFQRASTSRSDIEVALVAAGLKPSALLAVSPDRLPVVSQKASEQGLHALILARQGTGTNSYASTATPFVQGQPFEYRVAICNKSMLDHWMTAWKRSDDEMIGILLGYPQCCREFFKRYWVEAGYVDTTWPQAFMTNLMDNEKVINVHPDPACNVTLRHLGLRWVSHLPCSFKCAPTVSMVAESALAIKAQFPEEYRTLSEALQWPVKWTALHGITEIVTPVCRIVSRTDATAGKLTLLQHGSLYPEEGAVGNDFPFKTKRTHNVRVIGIDRWTLNGFPNYESMIKAHNTVIAAAGDMRELSIIDLGCGTGELLKVYKGIASELHGVDIFPDAVKQAKKYINVREMNIYDPEVFDRKFDVAFISVQRFLENGLWSTLLDRLKAHTKATIFYSYGEMSGWDTILIKPELIVGPNSAAKVVW